MNKIIYRVLIFLVISLDGGVSLFAQGRLNLEYGKVRIYLI